jgi:hypothetical protein
MPTLASPFRWRLIAQLSNAYEIHDVDLLDRRLSEPASDRVTFYRTSLRYPNLWTPLVERAARTRLGQIFLGFSRFPAARAVVDEDGYATVRWTDMRFAGGLISLDQGAPQRVPFTAMIRMAPAGEVLLEQFGP